MAVGKSVQRKDGVAKVTGKARYTDDFSMPGMRVAKYLRSPIAHGRVVRIDTTRAEKLPGVDGVFTFHDVPKNTFATAGHPFSLDPEHGDVADRLLLTDCARFQGDEVAVVVTRDDMTAHKALSLIEVEYENLKPLIRMQDVLAHDAPELHKRSRNLIKEHAYTVGGDYKKAIEESDHLIEGVFETQIVQHCHLENHSSYAYMDDMDRIVIVSSTQIPHIARRIVSEALNFPLSRIRVIKPHIGGGFGNKQDVILEPMVAFLTLKLGGIPIRLKLNREECMVGTRVRHPLHIQVKAGISQEGNLNVIDYDAVSNTGAYASHGHSIVSAAAAKTHYMYPRAIYRCRARTIYGNFPSAGAMRGYGSPQIIFAVESLMEDAARKLGIDSVDFRLKNAVKPGDINQIGKRPIVTAGLIECIEKGRDLIDWDKKRATLQTPQTGPVRKGLGIACFSYLSGTYPSCVEPASARLILNQDGSVNLLVGATEIGQGSDTVFAQMTAETLGTSYEKVHVVSNQDTDVTPFDSGAYASRQTYVTGQAVMRAASELKDKILAYAGVITGMNPGELDIDEGNIVIAKSRQTAVMSLKDLSMDAYYNKNRGGQITSEVSCKALTNAPSYGCTVVDLEIDIPMCKVKINEIYNIHDAGVIINPLTSEGQIHGGMAMGIGAALFEVLMVDPDSGRIYNNNMLDYKVPTIMDIPGLGSGFVQTHEPTHPYGSKSLGEPPVLTPAPAIRNAILDATGIAINELPMNPKTLFTHFKNAGLL
ncbi:MAG: xanthine dehydrogenase molybdenum-binding subunit XdhA [Desulfobacteraceae bacterium]|nr:xanthine dehydrogenase molybdenum-binding subunit XdhA [Desulfobacteraceae bacterium]